MTNPYGVTLDPSSVRWTAAEGVSETVIAAVLLLHEQSASDIASKLNASELEHVLRLVGRCPSCYPPGTLEAVKVRSRASSPEPVASISTDRPAARIEPDAEDMRRAKEGRLARLRAHSFRTARARERAPQLGNSKILSTSKCPSSWSFGVKLRQDRLVNLAFAPATA